MSEVMLLLQAMLLIAGWLLFVKAQTELRAQAARQSLTGETEELRRSAESLLVRVAAEAERLDAKIDELRRATHETLTPASRYSEEETLPKYERALAMTGEGMTSLDAAKQTGLTPGEVELIARLKKHRRS